MSQNYVAHALNSSSESNFQIYTILVVDDEELSRQLLVMTLEYVREQYRQASKQIQFIISEARNGAEALEFMDKNDVDILIVDVQMPAMNGFQVISALQATTNKIPVIVFVTASEKHALSAFDVRAVDYLLKPFTISRFEEALERALERLLYREQKALYDQLLVAAYPHTHAIPQTNETPPRYWQQLSLRSGKRDIIIAADEILWISSAESYIEIHLEQHTYLFRDSLRNAEAHLDPRIFVRVHRSALVNAKKIKTIEYNDHGDGSVTLVNGTMVKVSRYKKEGLLSVLADNL